MVDARDEEPVIEGETGAWVRCAWAGVEDGDPRGRSISARERMRTGVSDWKLGCEVSARGVKWMLSATRGDSFWPLTGSGEEEESETTGGRVRVGSNGQEEEARVESEECIECEEISEVCEEPSAGVIWRMAVGSCSELEDEWDVSCLSPYRTCSLKETSLRIKTWEVTGSQTLYPLVLSQYPKKWHKWLLGSSFVRCFFSM